MERILKKFLDNFNIVSGGRINKHKIQIYAWNIKAQSLLGIAEILSFSISNDWKSLEHPEWV
jgi:hypothetical protein